MRTVWHLTVLLLVTALALPVAGAQQLIDRRGGNDFRIEPSGMSLDQAVEMVQRRYRAKAVKAETLRQGERRVHQIRLLSAEGKVWNVRVDAETGAVQ